MMLLLLAALPTLFWDGAADTAPALREAGFKQILVPAARLASWKSVAEITAEAADLGSAVKLLGPTVNYRMNVASATNAPWIVANGWKFIRRPQGRFYYDVTGKQAALAAAEAYCYGVNAMVRTDAAGLKPLAEMLEFLRAITGDPLVRNNLLFQLVASPDRRLKVNVKLGGKEYPLEDAKNPGTVAHTVRSNLTDDQRSVRIYGSQVVVVRLTASGDRMRIHLLNYAGATRKVDGIRVRVLGQYPKHQLRLADGAGVELLDFSAEPDATEFTLPELKTYAVVDLSR
ncbi:MAG: hypothetical protein NTW28_04905 [Candidatus Solibacter sp.]|nr:hypothetical protein [Candidatus Solibacter sp.]